jgi:hypothetical protein
VREAFLGQQAATGLIAERVVAEVTPRLLVPVALRVQSRLTAVAVVTAATSLLTLAVAAALAALLALAVVVPRLRGEAPVAARLRR